MCFDRNTRENSVRVKKKMTRHSQHVSIFFNKIYANTKGQQWKKRGKAIWEKKPAWVFEQLHADSFFAWTLHVI